MPGWKFDPVHCASMTFGPPRVDVTALVESKRLSSGSCFDNRDPWLKSFTTLSSDEASALAERHPRVTRRRSRRGEVTCGAHQSPDCPHRSRVSSRPKRARAPLTWSGQSVTHALHRNVQAAWHSRDSKPNLCRTYTRGNGGPRGFSARHTLATASNRKLDEGRMTRKNWSRTAQHRRAMRGRRCVGIHSGVDGVGRRSECRDPGKTRRAPGTGQGHRMAGRRWVASEPLLNSERMGSSTRHRAPCVLGLPIAECPCPRPTCLTERRLPARLSSAGALLKWGRFSPTQPVLIASRFLRSLSFSEQVREPDQSAHPIATG